MTEPPFQRDRDEPEPPADPGRGQVDVRQQTGDRGQQPTDPVRSVAKQRRAAQIQDGGKGEVGAESQFADGLLVTFPAFLNQRRARHEKKMNFRNFKISTA